MASEDEHEALMMDRIRKHEGNLETVTSWQLNLMQKAVAIAQRDSMSEADSDHLAAHQETVRLCIDMASNITAELFQMREELRGLIRSRVQRPPAARPTTSSSSSSSASANVLKILPPRPSKPSSQSEKEGKNSAKQSDKEGKNSAKPRSNKDMLPRLESANSSLADSPESKVKSVTNSFVPLPSKAEETQKKKRNSLEIAKEDIANRAMELKKSRKRNRCGECAACKLDDCGNCAECLDKLKFGGEGKRHRACERRECLKPA